jgi:predicted amidophosphoribosyltransferase
MLGVAHAANLVRRVRNTPSQTELSIEQRCLNVRGAFAASGKRQRAGLIAARHVAIVDDVITTGSTTQELRSLLMAVGVAQVDVWAAAQVP